VVPNAVRNDSVLNGINPDDLSRDVYCILGVPIDAIGMAEVLARIRTAAGSASPFLLSTPNLNFLIASQTDADFRESLLLSDLCPADGMPVVWIARLLGIRIGQRIPGADIFDALMADPNPTAPLKVYFFGGAEGAAAQACRALNGRSSQMRCVGWLHPGFGPVEEMSTAEIVGTINASSAHLLAVSLGAKKGQAWLLRNHNRLRVPVRAHLGAVVNFHAGWIIRAPKFMQKWGFEWLWRIAQEPSLWRRYWKDGIALATLLITRILPLAMRIWWARFQREDGLTVTLIEQEGRVVVRLAGMATALHADRVRIVFKAALAAGKPVAVDLSATHWVDARVLGTLLMLNKKLKSAGTAATLLPLPPRLERLFRLHGLSYLLPGPQEQR
jgi:N-acetylglucosaminyldiphosphoundecaprenol N-acetyl-beta-D-mannosaminyltransferase